MQQSNDYVAIIGKGIKDDQVENFGRSARAAYEVLCSLESFPIGKAQAEILQCWGAQMPDDLSSLPLLESTVYLQSFFFCWYPNPDVEVV